MTHSLIQDFLATLEGIHCLKHDSEIGENVKNASGFNRKVPAVVIPNCKTEILRIVNAANRFRIPLYPISLGNNWGMGSRLPVSDDCVIVDLSRMNKVVEIDPEYGYAIIEPGVSQGQLADMLETTGLPYFVDVTGSGRNTSIIGNALERGVAYNTLRDESVDVIECVLGNGEVFTPGVLHGQNGRLRPYFAGPGPSLGNLFFQSNFGIVTQARISLVPLPEAHQVFTLNLKNDVDLFRLIPEIRALKKSGIVQGVVHIGNARRGRIALEPIVYHALQERGITATRKSVEELVGKAISAWGVVGSIMGTKPQVYEAKRLVKKTVGRIGRLRFITSRKLDVLNWLTRVLRARRSSAIVDAMRHLYGVNTGLPTDAFLRSVYWPITDRADSACPDRGCAGIRFCVPVIPMDAEAVRTALSDAREICSRFGFSVAITLNTLHHFAFEGVVSIDFPSDDQTACESARNCQQELVKSFLDNSFVPLRIDIDNMQTIVDPRTTYWKTVRLLKSVFDPNNVISPKRYNVI